MTKESYKIRAIDLIPYFGVSNYILRNQGNEKNPKARLRAAGLAIYTIALSSTALITSISCLEKLAN